MLTSLTGLDERVVGRSFVAIVEQRNFVLGVARLRRRHVEGEDGAHIYVVLILLHLRAQHVN